VTLADLPRFGRDRENPRPSRHATRGTWTYFASTDMCHNNEDQLEQDSGPAASRWRRPVFATHARIDLFFHLYYQVLWSGENKMRIDPGSQRLDGGVIPPCGSGALATYLAGFIQDNFAGT
jgi:hypothetical protein